MRSMLIEKERHDTETDMKNEPALLHVHAALVIAGLEKRLFVGSLFCILLSWNLCEMAGCSITGMNQVGSGKMLIPTSLRMSPANALRSLSTSLCRKPNVNHFPLSGWVTSCVQICKNPQVKISWGLEIRYEKVLSPLWLYSSSLALRPEPPAVVPWQNSHTCEWDEGEVLYSMEAIMFLVS